MSENRVGAPLKAEGFGLPSQRAQDLRRARGTPRHLDIAKVLAWAPGLLAYLAYGAAILAVIGCLIGQSVAENGWPTVPPSAAFGAPSVHMNGVIG